MEAAAGRFADPIIIPPPTDIADKKTAASTPPADPVTLGKSLPLPPRSHDANNDGVKAVPPVYWTCHGRSVSNTSFQSLQDERPPAIRLEDHTEDSHELALSCWAKSATIDEYLIVSGPTGIGAYVVWHCTVKTLKGGDLQIRKRYSEFDRLREMLVQSFPHAEAMIPELPRKSIVSRFRPRFLEHRKQGLSHFLNCILLNPEFAASPIMKEFIFD